MLPVLRSCTPLAQASNTMTDVDAPATSLGDLSGLLTSWLLHREAPTRHGGRSTHALTTMRTSRVPLEQGQARGAAGNIRREHAEASRKAVGLGNRLLQDSWPGRTPPCSSTVRSPRPVGLTNSAPVIVTSDRPARRRVTIATRSQWHHFFFAIPVNPSDSSRQRRPACVSPFCRITSEFVGPAGES